MDVEPRNTLERRDAVLEDGTVLCANVTAKEALTLYQEHFAGQAIVIDAVGPAEINGGRGSRKVWMPTPVGYGQKVKFQNIEITKLKRKIRDFEHVKDLLRHEVRTNLELMAEVSRLTKIVNKPPWWKFWA